MPAVGVVQSLAWMFSEVSGVRGLAPRRREKQVSSPTTLTPVSPSPAVFAQDDASKRIKASVAPRLGASLKLLPHRLFVAECHFLPARHVRSPDDPLRVARLIPLKCCKVAATSPQGHLMMLISTANAVGCSPAALDNMISWIGSIRHDQTRLDLCK